MDIQNFARPEVSAVDFSLRVPTSGVSSIGDRLNGIYHTAPPAMMTSAADKFGRFFPTDASQVQREVERRTEETKSGGSSSDESSSSGREPRFGGEDGDDANCFSKMEEDEEDGEDGDNCRDRTSSSNDGTRKNEKGKKHVSMRVVI